MSPRLVPTAQAREYLGGRKNGAPVKRGHVYFVGSRETKRIKIGFTATTPQERIASIQSNSAEEIVFLFSIEADKNLERALHRAFKEHRVRGEWFAWNEALVEFIVEASFSLHSAIKYYGVRWRPTP